MGMLLFVNDADRIEAYVMGEDDNLLPTRGVPLSIGRYLYLFLRAGPVESRGTSCGFTSTLS